MAKFIEVEHSFGTQTGIQKEKIMINIDNINYIKFMEMGKEFGNVVINYGKDVDLRLSYTLQDFLKMIS